MGPLEWLVILAVVVALIVVVRWVVATLSRR